MLVTRWWRQRVYYVAFAGEFKQAKEFCVRIVPCEGRAATNVSSHARGIALRDQIASAGFARKNNFGHPFPRAAPPLSPEVFLRLVNCAWYAQRVPVRISASF